VGLSSTPSQFTLQRGPTPSGFVLFLNARKPHHALTLRLPCPTFSTASRFQYPSDVPSHGRSIQRQEGRNADGQQQSGGELKRFFPRVPGSLLSILTLTAVVQLSHLPLDAVGSRFGSVPTMFPAPSLPNASWDMITRVLSPGATVAILGSIESLLSAVVADGMIRSRHWPNIELIAQGAANVLSPWFQASSPPM